MMWLRVHPCFLAGTAPAVRRRIKQAANQIRIPRRCWVSAESLRPNTFLFAWFGDMPTMAACHILQIEDAWRIMGDGTTGRIAARALLIDLDASAWLAAADPATRVVPASVFRGAVKLRGLELPGRSTRAERPRRDILGGAFGVSAGPLPDLFSRRPQLDGHTFCARPFSGKSANVRDGPCACSSHDCAPAGEVQLIDPATPLGL
jgi:hypothetical protein